MAMTEHSKKRITRGTLLIAVNVLVFLLAGSSVIAAKAADYSAVFDATYYAEHYPDLKSAYGTDSAKLLSHFLKYGMSEGRQANAEFNVNSYRDRYEDLRKAFGDDTKRYYLHYIRSGKAEGRIATGRAVSPQSGYTWTYDVTGNSAY